MSVFQAAETTRSTYPQASVARTEQRREVSPGKWNISGRRPGNKVHAIEARQPPRGHDRDPDIAVSRLRYRACSGDDGVLSSPESVTVLRNTTGWIETMTCCKEEGQADRAEPNGSRSNTSVRYTGRS